MICFNESAIRLCRRGTLLLFIVLMVLFYMILICMASITKRYTESGYCYKYKLHKSLTLTDH